MRTLKAAEEAVALYRALAAARPEAFNVDLSMSLGMITDVRKAAGDNSGVFDAIVEAIDVLTWYSCNRCKRSLNGWQWCYIKLAEEIGRDPDMARIAPILKTFEHPSCGGALLRRSRDSPLSQSCVKYLMSFEALK